MNTYLRVVRWNVEQTLKLKIKEVIRCWLDENNRRSLTHIVKKSGLSYSTVRRLAEGEREPQQGTVISALSAIMSLDEVNKILRPYYPNLAKLAAHDPRSSKKYEFLEKGEGDFEWQGYDPWILALASTPQGVSKFILLRKFGEICEPRIESLLNRGVLREINGRIKTSSENILDPSPASVLNRIRVFVENFDTNKVGDGAFYSYKSFALDEDQIQEILDIKREEERKINEVISRRSAHPNKVYVISSVGSFMDFES